MQRLVFRTLLAAALALASSAARAQTAGVVPAFEVASVKPASPAAPGADNRMRGGPGTDTPGQITYPRVSLLNLMMKAYDVEADQIAGPAWMLTEVYSVMAKLPRDTSKQDFQLMLQNLLKERFHLKIHHSTRDIPAYELTVANGGPKMRPTPTGADTGGTVPANYEPTFDKKGFPSLPAGAPTSTAISAGMVRSTNRVSMAQFAKALSPLINMSNGDYNLTGGSVPVLPRVIDKTGLTGKFDFTLEFAGTVKVPPQTPHAAGPAPPPGPIDPSGGPTLFSAVQEQLGLKLERAKKVTLDLLVIDQVDRVPVEN